MYSSPTTFVAKLLVAVQVLMTLDMPLSTTMALPVTSKPIESTVENLAWQAWIDLPPEQKQQVKSRKVTPKSIFTLPLRVECPEGHKHVDSKCIPIAIGSNDVLIDLNALGLLVGNTQTEDVYDYDDIGEEMSNPLAFGSAMPAASEASKSNDGIPVDLKPPAKDEPLKFNIFQNKFHIFHEEPLEDYAALSNEGLQSSEKEQNITVTTTPTTNVAANAATLNDLVSEASNFSESIGQQEISANKQLQTSLNLGDAIDFKIEAISIPASGNHSSVQLVTTIMDGETTTTPDDHNKQQDNDLTTLLQTESFLPLLNHTTATTLLNTEIYSLSTTPLREHSESSADLLSLSVDEEITTLNTLVEQIAKQMKNKQEYTRSVTLSPILPEDNDSGSTVDASEDHDLLKESTLAIVTNDDTLETTTPIQLDDTTIIETHSSLPASSATQQELKELLLQQEQALNNFEELQRMRKGQKDQHVVLKKSKVQPVEVLSTTTEANSITTTIATTIIITAATTSASLPTATKSGYELLSATTETATPLLTVHNENENNDRFYYQHFAKQDNNEAKLLSDGQVKQYTATDNAAAASSPVAVAVTGQQQPTTTAITSTANSYETEIIPLASEIDRAEEFRLINELVKGIQKPSTLTTITEMPTATAATTSTTTTTTTTTTATTPIILTDNNIESSTSSNALSESTPLLIEKSTLTTSQIWSKILPLLTPSMTTPTAKNSANESYSGESQLKESNVTQPTTSNSAFSSERSNRNSKFIRINGFNKISAAKFKIKDFNTETATPIAEEFTPYSSTTASSSSASSSTTENLTYEPYWWLPAFWRLDKPTSTEMLPKEQVAVHSEEQPLLLRFWSAYVPKSS